MLVLLALANVCEVLNEFSFTFITLLIVFGINFIVSLCPCNIGIKRLNENKSILIFLIIISFIISFLIYNLNS